MMRRVATVLFGLALLLAQIIASGHAHSVGLPQVASVDHSAPDLDGDCQICMALHVASKILLPGLSSSLPSFLADIAVPHCGVTLAAPRPFAAFRSRAPPQD
jgi:hypothetical protein